MRTIDKIRVAQGYVELRQAQLDAASNRVASAQVELWRATSPIIDRVNACRTITGRPRHREPITRISIDEAERIVRCHYPSDGGRPIRMTFDDIEKPIEEVIEHVRMAHDERRKLASDRTAAGLSMTSSTLWRMATGSK